MKKLLYLLFTIIVVGCSESAVDKNNGDNTIEDNTQINPPTITFKVRELWGTKLSLNRDNLTFIDGEQICGVTQNKFITSNRSSVFATYLQYHFAIDTLVININAPTHQQAKIFDFNLFTNLSLTYKGRGKIHPKKIGHIEFIGFNSDSRLLLDTRLMDDDSRIDYYSSNLSEEFIESITYEKGGYTCTPIKVFHKKDYVDNYYEETIISITVTDDEYNSNLNIGDKIGKISFSDKWLGEGWGSLVSNNYYILDKEYNK